VKNIVSHSCSSSSSSGHEVREINVPLQHHDFIRLVVCLTLEEKKGTEGILKGSEEDIWTRERCSERVMEKLKGQEFYGLCHSTG
jgi:hypothetical protein